MFFGAGDFSRSASYLRIYGILLTDTSLIVKCLLHWKASRSSAIGEKRKGVSHVDRRKRISVFTDGSCIGNPGKGGYCAIIRNGKTYRTITGSVSRSTNNRMELTAVIEGLSAVPHGSAVTVFTDSGYVERAINEGRLALWQQNGWHRIKTGEPVKNADHWLVLCELIRKRNLDVEFVKLKVHRANFFNNRADCLARMAAQMA